MIKLQNRDAPDEKRPNRHSCAEAEVMVEPYSRRRFIGISAAAMGLGLIPFRRTAKAEAELVTWRGLALGAVATIQIHHRDRAAAERLIARAIAEVRRLENLFSLYRDDSLLVALNHRGILAAPPQPFVELLGQCLEYARLTDGAFDPTVQPLWTLYANHFSKQDADLAGPSEQDVDTALACVGYRNLLVSRDRVAFLKRGMALTFNGIAQGFMTDRVIDLFAAEGIESTLVDLGEIRVLGDHPGGRPWDVGIASPEQPGRIVATLPVKNQAVATSGPYGFRFDPAGRFNHLFDPQTGSSASRYQSVTVVMPTATAADALSTAFSLMSIDRIERTLRSAGAGIAYVITPEGMKSITARG